MTRGDWIAIGVCLAVIAYFLAWVLYDHQRGRRRIREAGELPRITMRIGVKAKAAANSMQTMSESLARLSLLMGYRGKADPEFVVLKLMRWPWPTWRVTERPFDWRIDA